MIFELHYEPSNDFGSDVIELRDEIYVDDLLLANQAAQLHGRGEFYVTLVTRLAGADEPILEYLAPGDYVRLRNAVDTIWTDAMGSDHDLTGGSQTVVFEHGCKSGKLASGKDAVSVSQVQWRQPYGADITAAMANGMPDNYGFNLICQITGMTEEQGRSLNLKDFSKLSQVYVESQGIPKAKKKVTSESPSST